MAESNAEVNKLVVTFRDYDQVKQELRLPKEFYQPKERVMSLGEGMSTFAKGLAQQEPDISVMAVDLIYKIAVAKNPQTASNELAKELKLNLPPDMTTNNYDMIAKEEKLIAEAFKELREEKPKNLDYVAAMGGKLPFPNKSFDRIFSNRMLEHVNFAMILPELLRCLKDDGEIRIGGALLQAWLPDRLLSYRMKYDGGGGQFFPDEDKSGGIKEWMKVIDKSGACIYILTNNYAKRGEVSGRGIRSVSPLIIRKDENIPRIEKMSEEKLDKLMKDYGEESSNSGLNKLFKVNPEAKQDSYKEFYWIKNFSYIFYQIEEVQFSS